MWLFSPMERTTAPKAGKHHKFLHYSLNLSGAKSLYNWACYLRWHISKFWMQKFVKKITSNWNKTLMQNMYLNNAKYRQSNDCCKEERTEEIEIFAFLSCPKCVHSKWQKYHHCHPSCLQYQPPCHIISLSCVLKLKK